MLILAIDTSAVASAALVSDDTLESLVGSFATEDTRSHAEVLAPGIEALLAEAGVTGADVDADGHRGGARPVHRPALGHRHRPHPRLRLGQAALRPHEPGRHRPGGGGVHRRGAGVHRGHGRAAQGGLLGPVYPERRPAAAAGGRPARRLRRGPPGACRSTAPAPASTPTSSRPSRVSAPASRRPSRWASSPWPGSTRGSSCSTPLRCTCANPTPRCPARGSVRCERRPGHAEHRPQLPGGVTLRDMTAADIPAVQTLERRLFPVDAWPLQMFFDELAQTGTRRYVVAELAGRDRGLRRADVHPADRGRPDHRRRAGTGRQGDRLGAARPNSSGRAGCAVPRTCSWKSGPTTPVPSSCTAATDSNRSTSGPATTATASTR